MRKIFRENNIIMVSIWLTMALSGCDSNKKSFDFFIGDANEPDKTMDAERNDSESKTSTAPLTDSTRANLGIKNFDQINLSMSRLTGVAHTTPDVLNEFNQIKHNLPGKNSVLSFNEFTQISMVKLAGQYCHHGFLNPTQRELILGDLSNLWTKNLSEAFTEINQIRIMKHFATKFWGHRSNWPKGNHLRKHVTELFRGLTSGRADTQAETQRILRATCIVYLSSAPVAIL